MIFYYIKIIGNWLIDWSMLYHNIGGLHTHVVLCSESRSLNRHFLPRRRATHPCKSRCGQQDPGPENGWEQMWLIPSWPWEWVRGVSTSRPLFVKQANGAAVIKIMVNMWRWSLRNDKKRWLKSFCTRECMQCTSVKPERIQARFWMLFSFPDCDQTRGWISRSLAWHAKKYLLGVWTCMPANENKNGSGRLSMTWVIIVACDPVVRRGLQERFRQALPVCVLLPNAHLVCLSRGWKILAYCERYVQGVGNSNVKNVKICMSTHLSNKDPCASQYVFISYAMMVRSRSGW